jgi:hypothetical protein
MSTACTQACVYERVSGRERERECVCVCACVCPGPFHSLPLYFPSSPTLKAVHAPKLLHGCSEPRQATLTHSRSSEPSSNASKVSEDQLKPPFDTEGPPWMDRLRRRLLVLSLAGVRTDRWVDGQIN